MLVFFFVVCFSLLGFFLGYFLGKFEARSESPTILEGRLKRKSETINYARNVALILVPDENWDNNGLTWKYDDKITPQNMARDLLEHIDGGL
mgnify:CR=1 FL=1|tara:strand:- start:982 stop:1257 length:276 start_codon:yes stop_codon:yes gene_type:complete